jgi:hypothetical protein
MCGGCEAFSEAVGMSEVREVAAFRPDGDGGVGEGFLQPLLIIGVEVGAGDDEVRHAGLSDRCQAFSGKVGETRRSAPFLSGKVSGSPT